MYLDYKPIGSMIATTVPDGFYITKNGNRRQKTRCENVMPTSKGRFELKKWIDLALEEVNKNQHNELYERIKDHCKDFKWLQKEEALNVWCLQCYYYKSYIHWSDFEIIWM